MSGRFWLPPEKVKGAVFFESLILDSPTRDLAERWKIQNGQNEAVPDSQRDAAKIELCVIRQNFDFQILKDRTNSDSRPAGFQN